jgi:hypothetical protein
MGIDPDTVQFTLVDDEQMPDAAGLYYQRERSVIDIARGQLADPSGLIATLAHELAHELLLKGGHLTSDTEDHEQVTDLLPVFLGVGVFGANATVRDTSWSSGTMSGWSIRRQGYLSSLQLGYALAVFAFVRGEHHPKWVKHLRPDAGETMKAALHYLRKTGDTLFHPVTFGKRRGTPTVHQLADDLAHPSPTVRVNALWDIIPDAPAAELLPAVERCLPHRDPDVRRFALEALGKFGPAAAGLIPVLTNILFRGTPVARREAAVALGRIGLGDEQVIPALVAMLTDEDPALVANAGWALATFKERAAGAEPQLLKALEVAGNLSNFNGVTYLLAALLAARPDAAARIKAHFAEGDPELRRVVIGELLRQTRG